MLVGGVDVGSTQTKAVVMDGQRRVLGRSLIDTGGIVTAADLGMGRMVYWSGLLGGWSAFGGWLLAEVGLGRWIGQSAWAAILMIVAVGAAIGGGLSLLSGLVARQWHRQFSKFCVGLIGGAAAGLVGSVLGSALYAAA